MLTSFVSLEVLSFRMTLKKWGMLGENVGQSSISWGKEAIAETSVVRSFKALEEAVVYLRNMMVK